MAETESAGKKIWIIVAGGVILSLITTYLIPWVRDNVWIPSAKAVGRIVAMIGHHLIATVTIRWWLLWILIILSGRVLWRIVRAVLRRKPQATAPTRPSLHWSDFTEFVFEQIRWQWRYDSSGTIVDLVSRCPDCAYQLDLIHDALPFDLQPITIFSCDNCKKEKRRLNGDYNSILVRVKKEIDRLIVGEKWQNIVRQQMAARSEKMART